MFTTGWRIIRSRAATHWLPLRAARPPAIYRELIPDDASPAAIAQLTRHHLPESATLVDLVLRGVVRIEKQHASLPGSTPFMLYRQAANERALTPHEQILLAAIFQEDGRVALASIAPRLAWEAAKLEEALENEMTAAGWLDLARQKQREKRLAFSVKSTLAGATFLIGGLVLGVGFRATEWSQVSAGLAGGLAFCGMVGLAVGLVALGLGTAFSTLSEQGELAAAQWQGYALFLKQVLLGHGPPPEPFDACLPQAVALGLTQDLVRSRPSQGVPSLPPWLHALATLRETGDWGAKLALLAVAEAEPGDTPPTSLGR